MENESERKRKMESKNDEKDIETIIDKQIIGSELAAVEEFKNIESEELIIASAMKLADSTPEAINAAKELATMQLFGKGCGEWKMAKLVLRMIDDGYDIKKIRAVMADDDRWHAGFRKYRLK